MSEIEKDLATSKLEAKRAAVLAASSKSKKPIFTLSLIAFAAVGLIVFFGLKFIPAEEKEAAAGAAFAFVPQQGEVTYPLSDFKKGGLIRYYQHKAGGGVLVRYFVGVDADGKVAAAIDVCDECWQYGKGHQQVEDKLVCQNCSKSFTLEEVATSKDTCTPLALPHRVEDGKVILGIPDLLSGAKYFKKI